jgi:hypothetical protein
MAPTIAYGIVIASRRPASAKRAAWTDESPA